MGYYGDWLGGEAPIKAISELQLSPDFGIYRLRITLNPGSVRDELIRSAAVLRRGKRRIDHSAANLRTKKSNYFLSGGR